MTFTESAAIAAAGLTALVCAYRAPLLSLAYVVPLWASLAAVAKLVDISSASHPLRYLVPVLSLTVAMGCAWYYATIYSPSLRAAMIHDWRRKRRLYASIITFASSCTDIPALLFWRLPGEWVLVPLQIGACFAVVAVLCVPERWLRWMT
jgi:hypothetical protein